LVAKPPLKFDKMELAELIQLRDEIETVLNGKILMERKELQARIAGLAALERRRAKRGGKEATQPNPKQPPRRVKSHPMKGRKATAKYRGPNGETWAGRGLPPRWLTALEAKGKKREQFLIDK
jgi:DNA-binding protein H-NS